jgi:hypothetical protein
MREYKLLVPSDCVAANTAKDTTYSLQQMKNILKADIRESTDIDLEALSAANRTTHHPAFATSLRDGLKFPSRAASKPSNKENPSPEICKAGHRVPGPRAIIQDPDWIRIVLMLNLCASLVRA